MYRSKKQNEMKAGTKAEQKKRIETFKSSISPTWIPPAIATPGVKKNSRVKG